SKPPLRMKPVAGLKIERALICSMEIPRPTATVFEGQSALAKPRPLSHNTANSIPTTLSLRSGVAHHEVWHESLAVDRPRHDGPFPGDCETQAGWFRRRGAAAVRGGRRPLQDHP